ncbi:dihydrodipicolinate synthase family protein [Palleronia sp. LCG004]|uniref:dihydrodipicolinate synthase family protein n=1 Tax=Palleronia sp. LCG004 TaxID=3079304 RepID=UPI0029436E93|nr:dihydrodipicolinate synthase family protein [Palleronia sp. LCG004]WOI57275.1 dihydrodipicolinate synthase family protein [Palleronia sp. LCG004]
MSSASAATSMAKTAPRAHLFGISTAMVTPFGEDGNVDLVRFAGQADRVVTGGADGVTLFGTTGEGASLGPTEREAMLSAVLDAGISPDAVTVAIVASDLETAETQARAALTRGVTSLLLTPPFYFKGVDDDGVFDWMTDFIGRVADRSPRIILYHIPQMTGVSLDGPLIRRLKESCGEAIFGVKDSAGDWAHTEALLPMDDLAIMIGDERLLARAAPLGGAGAISGMANLMPEALGKVIREGRQNTALDRLVEGVVAHPVTPMVKALVGAQIGDAAWTRTRAPLRPADPAVVENLAQQVADLTS